MGLEREPMTKIVGLLGAILVIAARLFHWSLAVEAAGVALLLIAAFLYQTGFARWWTVLCAATVLALAWRMDASPGGFIGSADRWILPALFLAMLVPFAVTLVRDLLKLTIGAKAAVGAAQGRAREQG